MKPIPKPCQYEDMERRAQVKQLLIAFVAGSLVTGTGLGAWGYYQFQQFNTETSELKVVVSKQKWRLDNLIESQGRLQTELAGFKEQKDQSYDQTIGALIQAKENAGMEALYEMGIKALAEKDAPRAYFALAQVHKANPKYKAIAEHYAAAQTAYQAHQKNLAAETLKNNYLKAFDQQANRQFAQAKLNYQAVVQQQANYKDAKARLAAVNKQLSLQNQTRDLEQKKQWLAATYQLGFNHQANGRYAAARDTYQQIVNDSPLYKDTATRLKMVRAKAPPAPPVTQANSPAAGSDPRCFEIGQSFGRCASDPSSPVCGQIQTSPLLTACKGNPEFARGIQATTKRTLTPDADSGDLNSPDLNRQEPNPDPNSLLRGLSSFLKDM